MHTIIATSIVELTFKVQQKSIAEWLSDAINGNLKGHGELPERN